MHCSFFAQAQFLQSALENETHTHTMTQICSKVAFLCIQMLYNNCTSSDINHDSTCLHKRLYSHAAIVLMCAWPMLAQVRVHYHAVNTCFNLLTPCYNLAQKSSCVFVCFGWVWRCARDQCLHKRACTTTQSTQLWFLNNLNLHTICVHLVFVWFGWVEGKLW